MSTTNTNNNTNDGSDIDGHVIHSIIIMGVSGSGKSTIASLLSKRLTDLLAVAGDGGDRGDDVQERLEINKQAKQCKFIDGDDLHPRNNIIKMKSGQALNDDDRAPWLARINDVAYSLASKNELGIVVSSALKSRYRDDIRRDNRGMVFIYLKGSYDSILARLTARSNHYFGATLLTSQFSALEEPLNNNEPDVITIDTDSIIGIDQIVSQCIKQLNQYCINYYKNIKKQE
ncbi:gluconokinase [Cavenderia fasciculata]|uniref:Gluconokinase n=1 Tax=Cavenderia fasciculata TaxID=261658 RepID=F4PSL5_CACFS|nr:gluconokinase [Cavenderia fasciculata]EGG20707.1 gluconokinase [Cavenderia fasciculata]|eukprot:XP_004358557.1 gluconokinase [Cavenderia fasciculata]